MFQYTKVVMGHTSLLKALVRRDISEKYRGTFIGVFWSVLTPVLMLSLYSFVFGVIFNARWADGDGTTEQYVLLLFAGLIVFNMFAECINRAPGMVLSNVNYVKKVVFPIELLPLVTLCSAMFNAFISLLIWIAGYAIFYGTPHISILLAPIILLPLCIVTMSLMLFLSSIGVFARDLSQVVQVVLTLLMFLAPIFFPPSILPEVVQKIIQFNPITIPIVELRNVLLFSIMPNWIHLGIYMVVAVLLFWLSYGTFKYLRQGFADVV